MATTVTVSNPAPNNDDVWGRHRIVVLDVEIDDAYASGGLAFDPKDHAGEGTGTPLAVMPVAQAVTSLFVPVYDAANAKLVLLVGDADGGMAEAAADSTFAGEVVRVLVIFGA